MTKASSTPVHDDWDDEDGTRDMVSKKSTSSESKVIEEFWDEWPNV